MKHEKTIKKMLSLFHDGWMDESDKKEMDAQLLKEFKCTIEQLDEQIEIGVENGYSPKSQLSMILSSMRKDNRA